MAGSSAHAQGGDAQNGIKRGQANAELTGEKLADDLDLQQNDNVGE